MLLSVSVPSLVKTAIGANNTNSLAPIDGNPDAKLIATPTPLLIEIFGFPPLTSTTELPDETQFRLEEKTISELIEFMQD